MNDEAIFVSTNVEYDAVVGNKIDSRAERPFYVRGILPSRSDDDGEPSSDRIFGLRVALPKHSQCAASDHLHVAI